MTEFSGNSAVEMNNLKPGYMTAVKVLTLLLCLALQTALNIRLESTGKVAIPPQPENSSRWEPRLFQSLTFGQLPAVIDWIWIQVLLDSNLSHVERGKHPKVYYDLSLIADLDPVNFDAYKAGAQLLAVVRDDGPGAKDLLMKAESFRKEKLPGYPQKLREEFWEYPWSIPLLLAYVNLFELNDLPAAAINFKDAAQLPGSPLYLQSLQKRLQAPGGEYEVGLRLLNFMIDAAKDDESRQGLLKKRNSLYIGQYLFDLNHSFREFLNGGAFRGPQAGKTNGSIETRWRQFLRESRSGEVDPWGGRLSLDPNGRIVTTTAHDRVFNLD